MPNIVHRIGFEGVGLARAFDAIATLEGLSAWWTPWVTGETSVGGVLAFRFPDQGPDFQVIQSVPPSRVHWQCVGGPDEWLETQVLFELSEDDGEVVLMFGHRGWREEVPFMHHCSTQWASFLISMKAYLETGVGRPQGPRFESISRWHPKPASVARA